MSTDVDPGKPVVLVSGDFLLESIKAMIIANLCMSMMIVVTLCVRCRISVQHKFNVLA